MFIPGELWLRGEEVTLRPLTGEDAQPLSIAAAESREHYGFTRVPNGPADHEAAVAAAIAQRERGERFPFAVIWCGRIVGTTSYLSFQPWQWERNDQTAQFAMPDAVEIGSTWLAASAMRTRCNTETKLLLMTHAFESWKVLRLSLRTDARNARSRRAIERLGAAFEGILRADKPAADGTVRDSACYSILAAEWPYISERLRERLTPRAAYGGI